MFKNDLILDMAESLGESIKKSVLNERDDCEEIVIENNFSGEEINQGIEDFQKIIKNYL